MHELSTHSDEQLVRLLKEDAEPAFRELYDRFLDSLFTKAYNFLRQEDAAKDCVQDVFIWLWQHRATVEIHNVSHYLHQAVRFQALKAIRQHKADLSLDERLNDFTLMILEDDKLPYKELKNLLQKIIASLPDDQQVIFKLHREEGFTYREIAEKLGISIKTVEKKMSLALKHIRSGMDDGIAILLLAQILN